MIFYYNELVKRQFELEFIKKVPKTIVLLIGTFLDVDLFITTFLRA